MPDCGCATPNVSAINSATGEAYETRGGVLYIPSYGPQPVVKALSDSPVSVRPSVDIKGVPYYQVERGFQDTGTKLIAKDGTVLLDYAVTINTVSGDATNATSTTGGIKTTVTGDNEFLIQLA